MCGIVGVVGSTSPQKLKKAVQAIAGRGPDEQCTWKSHDVQFGHARLAIVDLSETGRQPMTRNACTIVFNGEIYNHSALRDSLKKSGVQFVGESDTEVLLALYEQEGVRCLNKLEGMFAFALWDEKKKELFVARDRFGQKPLIYTTQDSMFYFGSSIPAVLALTNTPSIDPNGLQMYFLQSMMHIPAPYTACTNIFKLRAGSYGVFKEGVFAEKQWYTPVFKEEKDVSLSDLQKQMHTTVSGMLDCDVPVAAFLSGGTDSSLVSSYLSDEVAGLRTYALGASAEEDDLVRARAIAEDIGTNHTEILAKSVPYLDIIERLVDECGEPYVQTSAVFSYAICEKLKGKGKVLFSGAAGDELFYGYDNRLYLKAQWAQRLMRLFGNAGAKVCERALSGRNNRAAALASSGYYKPAVFRFDAQRNKQLFTEHMRSSITADAGQEAERILSVVKPRSLVDEFYISGLLIENTHSIQVLSDVTGMAHGIEIRNPFLERSLVEFAMSIPYAKKIGWFSEKNDKRLLKDLLESRLSTAKWVVRGKKHGFGSSFQPMDVLKAERKRVEKMCYTCSDANILTKKAVSQALRSCYNTNSPFMVLKLYALGYWLSSRKLSLK